MEDINYNFVNKKILGNVNWQFTADPNLNNQHALPTYTNWINPDGTLQTSYDVGKQFRNIIILVPGLYQLRMDLSLLSLQPGSITPQAGKKSLQIEYCFENVTDPSNQIPISDSRGTLGFSFPLVQNLEKNKKENLILGDTEDQYGSSYIPYVDISYLKAGTVLAPSITKTNTPFLPANFPQQTFVMGTLEIDKLD